jgi:alginate O-acetyltransferase complex protein AlgI
VLQALLMFNLVCIGWLFFRAASWEQATGMLLQLFADFRVTDYAAYAAAMLAFFALPLMVYEWFLYRSKDMLLLLHRPVWQQTATLGYFIAMLVLFPPLTQQVFIYFQF